jgi:DNA-binding response OmpR family regulator
MDNELKRSCLIIDDDKAIQDCLGEILTKSSFKVFNCYDGVDAGWRISNQDFSIVIVDKNLPKRNGLALIKNEILSGRLDAKKVILISGLLESEDIIMMKELRLEHILVKPFKIADIQNKVAQIIKNQGA